MNENPRITHPDHAPSSVWALVAVAATSAFMLFTGKTAQKDIDDNKDMAVAVISDQADVPLQKVRLIGAFNTTKDAFCGKNALSIAAAKTPKGLRVLCEGGDGQRRVSEFVRDQAASPGSRNNKVIQDLSFVMDKICGAGIAYAVAAETPRGVRVICKDKDGQEQVLKLQEIRL